MQSDQRSTKQRVPPVALDMGRTFWVMARVDEQGQPEVASLGDQGLIAAVISEYQEEVLVGQHYKEPGGFEPLMDYPACSGRWSDRNLQSAAARLQASVKERVEGV